VKSNRVKIILVLGVLGLLTTMLAVLPASGDEHTVAIVSEATNSSALEWTNPTAIVVLRIEDDRENVSISTTSESVSFTACDGTGNQRTIKVDNAPILDSSGDGIINFNDVSVSSDGNTGTTVFSVDATNATVVLSCAASSVTTTQELDYDAAGANTVGTDEAEFDASDVQLSSDADEVGIGIALTEVDSSDHDTAAVDSGVFALEVQLCITADCSDGTATPPTLEVSEDTNDTIVLEFDGDTYSVDVEGDVADFANFDPVDDTATDSQRPTVSGDVTDSDSLVDEDTIEIIARARNVGDTSTLEGPESIDPAEDGDVEDITGGFSISQRIPSSLINTAEDVYNIEWWIIADDIAGNRSVSDEDDDTTCYPATFDLDTGGTATGGCDPYSIRIDVEDPSLSSAVAGNWFDSDDEVRMTGTDAILTSIELTFNEDLDGDTVDLGDFDSDDVAITAADWYSDEPTRVYLTVSELDADDEPDIELVDNIYDLAGNKEDEGEVTATDGIPPGLTVTITGLADSRTATDETITITIVSDEALTGAPSVTVQRIEDDDTASGDEEVSTVTLTATRTWEVELDISAEGLYNIYVTGTDLGARLESEVGQANDDGGTAQVIDLDEADYFFEVDAGIPTPAYPLTSGDTDDPDTFISIDFSEESTEYGLDEDDAHTTTAADVSSSYDSHNTITLVEVTLDDVIIWGTDTDADGLEITVTEVVSDDDITFLYKAEGLAIGEHELVIEVQDEVGNEVTFTHTFDVTEKDPFTVQLFPGWNLISIPDAADEADLDVSIPNTHPADTITTYDAAAGAWLTAVRDDMGTPDDSTDDTWVGDLTALGLQPNVGYWVHTDTFEDLDIDIPGLEAGSQDLPPAFQVGQGWNLVGISSLDIAVGTIDSDDYFATVEWARAYSYNAEDREFEGIIPEEADADTEDNTVTLGLGYWVWIDLAGTLVP
jgi:hypothetical protein